MEDGQLLQEKLGALRSASVDNEAAIDKLIEHVDALQVCLNDVILHVAASTCGILMAAGSPRTNCALVRRPRQS